MASPSTPQPARQIPQIPREPYDGPDIFTTLPSELLVQIFGFLHARGDQKWRNKKDFKTINLIGHPKLCAAVREQMFRYMLLKFSYRGQMVNGIWVWDTPKLILFVEAYPELRDFIKGLRVSIKPVPIRTTKAKLSVNDFPTVWRPGTNMFLHNWEQRLISGAPFAAFSPTYGFVDEPDTTTTLPPTFSRSALGIDQDDLFYHLFGMFSTGTPGTISFPNFIAQHPFIFHVLNTTRHRLLFRLQKLVHMEAGLWPGPNSGWSRKEYDAMSQFGRALSTALILKTAPPDKVTSVRFEHFVAKRSAVQGYLRPAPEVNKFVIWNIAARLEHYGHHLTNFDLSIDNTLTMPGFYPNQRTWPDQMSFWAEMLESLTNLESLRLHDAREKFEPREEQNLDLNMLFNMLSMPQVRILHLAGWSVTPEIMTEKLVWSFSKLRFLDLELLDMRSNDENCWVTVLGTVKKYYGESNIGFGPLVDLRQRALEGKDAAYVKYRVKPQAKTVQQIDGVWNKVAQVEDGEDE